MPVIDKALFVSVEGTRGDEEGVDTADAIHYRTCDFAINGSGPIQRGANIGIADTLVPYKPQTQYWGGSLETEWKVSSTLGTACELSPVLEAAGFSETLVTSSPESATYDLLPHPNLSTAAKCVTLRKEEGPAGDGNSLVAIGVLFGGLSLSWSTDEPLRVTFPWIGQYKPPAALGSLTTPTFNAGTPVNVLKSTGGFTLQSYSAILRSVTINAPLQLTPRGSGSAVSTYGYTWPCAVFRSEPISFEFEIEAVDEDTFGLFAKFGAATAADSSIVLSAGSTDLTITLRNTVFGAPVLVPGVPNAFRVSGTAHQSGSNGALTIAES
jgi:hypothetical protein